MGVLADEGICIVKWSGVGIVIERPIPGATEPPMVRRALVKWPITEQSLHDAITSMDFDGPNPEPEAA